MVIQYFWTFGHLNPFQLLSTKVQGLDLYLSEQISDLFNFDVLREALGVLLIVNPFQ